MLRLNRLSAFEQDFRKLELLHTGRIPSSCPDRIHRTVFFPFHLVFFSVDRHALNPGSMGDIRQELQFHRISFLVVKLFHSRGQIRFIIHRFFNFADQKRQIRYCQLSIGIHISLSLSALRQEFQTDQMSLQQFHIRIISASIAVQVALSSEGIDASCHKHCRPHAGDGSGHELCPAGEFSLFPPVDHGSDQNRRTKQNACSRKKHDKGIPCLYITVLLFIRQIAVGAVCHSIRIFVGLFTARSPDYKTVFPRNSLSQSPPEKLHQKQRSHIPAFL